MERKPMSANMEEAELELEELLRRLTAEGEYPAARKAAERFLQHRISSNLVPRFQRPGTIYQYTKTLSRLGEHEKALSLRFSDLTDWPGFTDELKGDWHRDGHARFYLAKGNVPAARGAVLEAMKLHVPGTPKHLLDELVLAIVHLAQNRPEVARRDVEAVITKMKGVKSAERIALLKAEAENTQMPDELELLHNFDPVERIANWWLLLLKCLTQPDEDVSGLASWVATHDASERRQRQALELRDNSGKTRARHARRIISKEIKDH